MGTYLDAGDIQLWLGDEITTEDADSLITKVEMLFSANRECDDVTAVPSPTPDSVKVGLLMWAAVLMGADIEAYGSGVAAEQLGQYSYRRMIADFGSAAKVPRETLRYLSPYLCAGALIEASGMMDMAVWPDSVEDFVNWWEYEAPWLSDTS